MAVQKVFKRYEYKYLLTREQKELLQNVMEEYMIPDEYGKSTICNLYFDTPQYLLIRRSIENKVYKEKCGSVPMEEQSRQVRHLSS